MKANESERKRKKEEISSGGEFEIMTGNGSRKKILIKFDEY